MKPKKLPRLWCALQGLLPLETAAARPRLRAAVPVRKVVATGGRSRNVRRDGLV